MIANHQAELFKLNANEIVLCGNLISIFFPHSWSLEREVRSPRGSIASFTKARVNGDLHLSVATYLDSVNLPSTAKLWVQSVKPAATVENKLELLRESSDIIGSIAFHQGNLRSRSQISHKQSLT